MFVALNRKVITTKPYHKKYLEILFVVLNRKVITIKVTITNMLIIYLLLGVL